MKIWIITLFPEFFDAFCEKGVVGQVFSNKRKMNGQNLSIESVQLRNFSTNNYKGVDDGPYGGGPGMVMRADVLKNALIEGVVKSGGYGEDFRDKLHIVFPSPHGRTWDHQYCHEFAKNYFDLTSVPEQTKDLVFICGRYEGIDQRFIDLYVDEMICLGPYVLTGGEIATMAIIDSALRFAPGVLGNKESAIEESFNEGLLEHPQYTRPYEFEGLKVPDVLVSGDHKKIADWKERHRIKTS